MSKNITGNTRLQISITTPAAYFQHVITALTVAAAYARLTSPVSILWLASGARSPISQLEERVAFSIIVTHFLEGLIE